MFYRWVPRLITIPPLPDFNYGLDGVCDVLEQDVFMEHRSQTNTARCLTGTTVNFVCDNGNTALAVSSSLSHVGDKEVEQETV